jgi:LysR family nitrogen assimilation transcriptional regulator
MNFRQMGHFVAVYEDGSFSRAAARARCTQSGLSQQIRNLEDRLGLALFERTAHGVVPTLAGRRYYERCIPILRSVHAAEDDMHALQGSLAGSVNAGLIPSLTKGALAVVLARFTAENPNVDVRIVEAYSQPLTDLVLAGELDFAIVPVMPPTDIPGLSRRVLAREQELLLSGAALGLENTAPIPFRQVSGLKLVLPSPENSRRPFLEGQMAAAGVVPERIMDLDGMTGTLEFVAESDWATILPVTNCIGELDRGRLVLSPIVAPEIEFEFILIEPSSRPLQAAAERFVSGIEAQLAEIDRAWRNIRGRDGVSSERSRS